MSAKKATKQSIHHHGFAEKKRVRRDFGRIKEVTKMPNLIDLQKNSYKMFLQDDVTAETRQEMGLHDVLKSVFPISAFSHRTRH